MTPYYDDGTCVIYHGDAREVARWRAAQVLVTDPPYGLETVAGSYGRNGARIANDRDTRIRDAVLGQWGPDKACLVFSTPRLPEPPGRWDYRLVWDKAEAGLNGGPWRYNHELIFVAGEGWIRVSASSFSVLRFPARNGSPERGDHPHRKPLALMRALASAAPPGVIADPFMGSGTTLRAAKDCGRRAIGVEVEERYCEIAAKRLSQEVLDFGAAS